MWGTNAKRSKLDILVRAVRVEPVAAATSFAWEGSMGPCGGGEEDGREEKSGGRSPSVDLK